MQKSQNPEERILKAAPNLVTYVTMRWEEGKRGRGEAAMQQAGTGQENGLEKVSPGTSYNDATQPMSQVPKHRHMAVWVPKRCVCATRQLGVVLCAYIMG